MKEIIMIDGNKYNIEVRSLNQKETIEHGTKYKIKLIIKVYPDNRSESITIYDEIYETRNKMLAHIFTPILLPAEAIAHLTKLTSNME